MSRKNKLESVLSISSQWHLFFSHFEKLYGHQGHHFHLLYLQLTMNHTMKSKEITYIRSKMLTRWWGACKMRISSLSSLFFSLPFLGTARWQSSSSAVLFIHSSYLMGILLPSFKEAMCLRNDICDKRKLLFSKLILGWGAWGQQRVCALVCVCIMLYGE